jgi:putative ABC transport system substrate-binding protein
VRRRDFIKAVGGAATTWPLVARAQQATIPVVGFLHAGSPEPNVNFVVAFRTGLGKTGYVEGQNNFNLEPKGCTGFRNQLRIVATNGTKAAARSTELWCAPRRTTRH